jgi:tetratricopeptide (TPR) repeat protein
MTSLPLALHSSPLAPRPSAFGVRPSFGFRVSAFGFLLTLLLSLPLLAASPDSLFRAGATAYRAGDYARAAEAFRQSVALQPASGALQDLGNAEWQCRRPGAAILAWERSRLLDPFNQSVRQNLLFVRKTAQLEAPELTWYEVISTWLPASWWAWIAGASLWFAVGMGMLPCILRRRKATWHHAMAALGLMIFLLSIPAYIGVETRSRIGFVLQKDTPLLLTPTLEAQAVTRLAAGEPARWVRARGNYVLIRTSRALGWLERDQFGLICPRTGTKQISSAAH